MWIDVFASGGTSGQFTAGEYCGLAKSRSVFHGAILMEILAYSIEQMSYFSRNAVTASQVYLSLIKNDSKFYNA